MKNKFYLFALSAAALMSASCANDVDLTQGTNGDGAEGTQQPIGFQFLQKNGTRADNKNLNETSHYNFGMFAYKTGGAGSVEAVMDNYLVGYGDATNKKGYSMNETDQTTWGSGNNNLTDNKSLWAYEKLGSSEYNYEGTDGYFTKSQTAYMSNCANQYLKYFDESSSKTDFYAYAPYVNATDAAKRVSFDNRQRIMTFPAGVIKECVYNDDQDVSLVDFMYARTQVAKANYKQDVSLQFKRLNSKINIQFYEQVAGYKVKLIDLKNDEDASKNVNGITMVPAKKNGDTYTYGTLYKEAGVSTLEFDETATQNPTINLIGSGALQYTGAQYVTFNLPAEGDDGNGRLLGETKEQAKKSPTTYYIIPFNNASGTTADNSGLTFHVSYELEAEDTHEIIRVYDARVHVPEACCHWESNKLYTYTFKITKSSTGTTDKDKDVDPSDPGIGEQALYPIVFDNVTVADWEAVDDEHTITE